MSPSRPGRSCRNLSDVSHGEESFSERQRGFQIHAAVYLAVNAFLFMIWLMTTPGGFPWFLIPAGGWGIGLVAHAAAHFSHPPEIEEGTGYKSLGP